MEYNIEINENNEVLINKIPIKEDIFNEELIDYSVREREQQINDLIRWISEANKDKNAMMEDLKYLINAKDEYLFSSITTNKYILKSDNKKEFNAICKRILALNKIDPEVD